MKATTTTKRQPRRAAFLGLERLTDDALSHRDEEELRDIAEGQLVMAGRQNEWMRIEVREIEARA